MSKKSSPKSAIDNIVQAPLRMVGAKASLTLSESKLASLYQSLVKATQKTNNSGVIQFLSAYRGEGAGHISFELANFVASNTDKSVLFLDASFVPPPSMQFVSNQCEVPLCHYMKTGSEIEHVPLVKLEGNGLCCGRFYENTGENTYIDPDNMKALFDVFRSQYDVIILYTEALLENESATLFSTVSDGTVIVVQAERTRSQVVKRLSDVIKESGGQVIGSILNERRFYTPRWVHKIFFP